VSSLLESPSLSSSSPSRRRSFLLRHAALAASAVTTTTTTDPLGLRPVRSPPRPRRPRRAVAPPRIHRRHFFV
jgi:hypothetical protein